MTAHFTAIDTLLSATGMMEKTPSFHTITSTSGASEIQLDDQGGTKTTCALWSVDPKNPTIIYFYDLLSSTAAIQTVVAGLLKQELNVLIPGYAGDCTAPFSQLAEAAGEMVFSCRKWLQANLYAGPVFIMGRSLGGIVAMEAICRKSELAKGFFLESPVCDTISFLRAATGNDSLELAENESFATLEKIAGLTLPTMIFHGAKDSWVSIREAEKLQSHCGAKNKQFFVIPGAERDNLPEAGGELYFQTIKKFIDGICGTNTWREKRRKFKVNTNEG